jgi:hypothetical protein
MKRDRRKGFMNAMPGGENNRLRTMKGEHARRTEAKLLARRGLVWRTRPAHPPI